MESALAQYLVTHGWPFAERRSLKGGKDQGDITGTPGLCWEAKWANGGLRLAKWLAETGIERINSRADHGILVVKPVGIGTVNIGKWYAAMDYLDHESLRDKSTTWVMASEPQTYEALAVAVGLVQAEWLRGDLLYAMTMVPPGAKDQPNRYYRVMYLKDMVRLLRLAGYGEPPGETVE